MARQKQIVERLLVEDDASKIRKRGCSPSSLSSSIIQNYRFKKVVLVGKQGGGSSTPVPTWRIAASRSPSISLRIAAAAETPRSQMGRSTTGRETQPVSARKLAATLWELNEIPAPLPEEGRRRRRREGPRKAVDSVSGSLPRHLSDPSHSPVSERSDRSGKGTHRRRQSSSSLSRRLGVNARDVGVLDSVSNASFMEIETKSRCQSQTPAEFTAGSKNRLKDVSNALTTSKELLKIISRMWGQEDYEPSSSMSLISALHVELERARLQVNQLVQEQRPDKNEINYLLKCFAEEKAAWKNKEKEAIQAAIESIAGELEVERKLRRRIESLNKKLGKELAETKELFSNAMKELENEKRTKGIIEHVCNDLAWNIAEDKDEVEELKRDSVRMREQVEKEKKMLHIADALRETRDLMKLSEAKHQFVEKNAAVNQLKDELEAFLKDERGKEKAHHASINHASFGFSRSDEEELDGGEVEDVAKFGDDSAETDLHSIELNMNRIRKGHKSGFASVTPRSSKTLLADEELIRRMLIPGGGSAGKGQRRSTSLLRSVSNMVEGAPYGKSLQASGEGGIGIGHERFSECEKQTHRRSCGDDLQRYKTVKGLRDHILSSSRLGPCNDVASSTGQGGQRWLRDLGIDRSMIKERGTRECLEDARVDSKHVRRSRR